MLSKERKIRIWFAFTNILLLLAVGACQGGLQETQPVDQPGQEVMDTLPAPEPVTGARPAVQLPVEQSQYFAASGNCASCHTRMLDQAGNEVSIDAFWRSTMMANSARDPYWQASVRVETLNHPEYKDAIEEKCAVCHMPMASFTLEQAGEPVAVLDRGLRSTGHELHPFAIDGVSCSLCHQIEDENLGQQESFSGGFVIDQQRPLGERLAYGPYQVPADQAQIMAAGSGFLPVFSKHIEQAEVCGTCHNLTTNSIEGEGIEPGEFHEQMVYLEWAHSRYQGTNPCQTCHMPVARGAVTVSITGSPPRSPFFQHFFVGGNTYMPQILDTYGNELEVTASSDHFADTRDRALDQLQNRTAQLGIEDIQAHSGELVVDVSVASFVGHKLPAGFPSRRVWLHFKVEDASGNIVFESGRPNPDGSIEGNANDLDPNQYEPHYQVITSPDEIQIYEVIFLDSQGNITTGLMQAFQYLKDNRLLPAGFDKQTASPEIAVYGQALDDRDFSGGSDRLRYRLDLGEAEGPFTVSVDLLYQSIAFRWIENLRGYESPETARMSAYYDAHPDLPVVVSSVKRTVSP